MTEIQRGLAAKLAVNPGYQAALRDAESESWDGPGIDVSAMIAAANERRGRLPRNEPSNCDFTTGPNR